MPLPTRIRTLQRLESSAFDIAIIGGGITGAGVARDAALRGLRVALLEQGDFAQGTSSRSSRLIHGGVRYLEHGHLRLVFEASRERRILLRIAPHLVRPLAFTWPVYAGARISRLKLSLGLGLYDALAMFRNVARHTRLSRDELAGAEPSLRTNDLLGGARYFDASTNDARLTLANVIDAMEHGAVALNHAQVVAIGMAGGRAAGLHAVDRLTGHGFTVRARQVVNAAGPWSDDVRSLEETQDAPGVMGSAGAHIAVDAARVGNRGAITMVHPDDGRVLFTLPAGRETIFGTTETPTPNGAREVRASRDDVRYLLRAANHYFPDATLGERDVLAAWAGIRPLVRQLAGAEVGSASREHAIERGPGGMIHVTGGKLTTYREMAGQIVDRLDGADRLPGRGQTARRPLPGGELALEAVRTNAMGVIEDAEVRERFVSLHGSRWRQAWEEGSLAAHRERLTPDLPLIPAELLFAVRHEMAVTLGDLLLRRTGVAFHLADQGRSLAPVVARLLAAELGWDGDAVRAAVADYEREVERTFATTTA